MSPIRSLSLGVLLVACAQGATVPRAAPAVAPAPSMRAEASHAAIPCVVMDATRVCVVTHDAVRCGSRVSGEAEPLWNDAMTSVLSIALGYRACVAREGRAACVVGSSQDRTLRPLPFEAPVRDVVIDGVHARVCAHRREGRVRR